MRHRLFIAAVPLLVLASIGSAAAQPAAKVPRIGFLAFSPPPPSGITPLGVAFVEGLRDLGYEDGRNVVIEYRYADPRPERLPALAAELVQARVDVILTTGDGEGRAARQATSTVPIVMAVSGDPVGAGHVESLARPGGNVTGLSYLSPDANVKLLALLRETVPAVKRVAFVWNAANPLKQLDFRDATAAAQRLGPGVHSAPVHSAAVFDAALAGVARNRPDAVVTLVDEFTNQEPYRRLVLEFAARHRLPAVAADARHALDGALMSYGPSLIAMFRYAAVFIDKILKGASPATLPVEEPRQFELALNRRTARTLNLTFPGAVLLRADRIID